MASPKLWVESDSGSDVSSISFIDQEPSDTFHFRVLDSALQKIWPDAVAEEIGVEDVLGSENRIIYVYRHPIGQPELHERFVIRTPRYDVGQLNGQIATLRFLRINGKIPAPVNLTFDKKDDNVLRSRYLLQNFIPGSTLLSSWSSLSQDHRCKVARELGHVYRELLTTRSDIPGFLTLSRGDTAALRIIPLEPGLQKRYSYNASPTPSDVHRFLINVFLGRWVILDEPLLSNDAWPTLRDQLCRMASEMATEGWFKDCYISLAHINLVPRNVMVNPTDTASPIISAILDWDSAVFAPQFTCCQPPMWLWNWNDGGEQDERLANETPSTPEAQQLKEVFEEAAGPEYARFAYAPAYRLARRLVRFVIEDIQSNEDYQEAEQIIEEWKEMRDNSKVHTPVTEENVWDYAESLGV
ncbi:hypothetical protein F5Y02DRAFT_424590 [Annulohypoxylon stygium]|nr:hypothetical protein F5Y02DRAFT_424590 [Annulohypoxylon stygium]